MSIDITGSLSHLTRITFNTLIMGWDSFFDANPLKLLETAFPASCHHLITLSLIKTLAVAFKGQLISKWFFGSSISSKKRTSKFDFATMKPQVDLFSFVFWRKLKTPKGHFEIIWPLVPWHLFFGDLSQSEKFSEIKTPLKPWKVWIHQLIW